MFKFEKIRKERERQKIFRPEFSRLLLREGVKVSIRTLVNWETGATTPNARELEAIVYVLNIPITKLFTKGKHNGK